MVVEREGVVTTALAVEVAWDTTKMGYDLVAPSTVASSRCYIRFARL